ncbi:hypothetical protein EII12_08000 [Buchananella hordeovulneris]|uniref:GST N-terminal domain-containing protein n=1 Tax=Buchananella hordeovulneris TaxID=52770 RepID=A0A1Q5PV39_9ACTO|nr:hypothetical protein [Buchananella hordeovulneris]OKL51366.1 hypothetical protein BSZ40_07270 [Buchananella hordeovulneris]RRD51649.1 hypothetical protein EII12_08000 [Buchananella hordeovulneris]
MTQVKLPPAAKRFHLLVAGSCPWCRRVTITRRLLGLADAVGITYASGRGEHGWEFAQGLPAALGEVTLLRDLYARDPEFSGRATVPAVADLATARLVQVESAGILWWLIRTMEAFHAPGAPLLLPHVACGVAEFWHGTDESLTKPFGRAIHATDPAERQAAAAELTQTLIQMNDKFDAVIAELVRFGENTLADVVLFSALTTYFGLGDEKLPVGSRPQDLSLDNLRAYVHGLMMQPDWLVPEEEAALPGLRVHVTR